MNHCLNRPSIRNSLCYYVSKGSSEEDRQEIILRSAPKIMWTDKEFLNIDSVSYSQHPHPLPMYNGPRITSSLRQMTNIKNERQLICCLQRTHLVPHPALQSGFKEIFINYYPRRFVEKLKGIRYYATAKYYITQTFQRKHQLCP